MNFETYINQAWADHATQSVKVAEGFASATKFVETNEQLAQMVNLVTHVMGEHLAKWNEGIELLGTLKANPKFEAGTETERAIHRSIEVMKIGGGQPPSLSGFSTSDQIRIMAVAGSALSERNAMKAKELLTKSLELARTGLDQKDPANRGLAVTGNNLACALEQKSDRNQAETDLMILAAQTGRKYWELVGTWLEVSRAEYRLAMTFLQAQDLNRAFDHAQTCVELCQNNKAGEMDMFYCYEALALVEKARGNEIGFTKAVDQVKRYFDLLSAEDKSWCEKSLKKLALIKN
jgi:hypothetical protein